MTNELFDYFDAHRSELIEKFDGKYLVITRDGVQSVWDEDSDVKAYFDASSKYGDGNFILPFCTSNPRSHIVRNYSILSVTD